MANRTHHPLDTPRCDTKILFPKMAGAGAADLVKATGLDCLDILTAVRTGAGIFNLTFRNKYPMGIAPLSPGIIGTTTGLVAIFTAWNAQAGTATVKFSVGSVATDPALTDTICFAFVVRNSGKN